MQGSNLARRKENTRLSAGWRETDINNIYLTGWLGTDGVISKPVGEKPVGEWTMLRYKSEYYYILLATNNTIFTTVFKAWIQ